VYFDELWRVNVRSERGPGESTGTQETIVPQKAAVSKHLDKLELTAADLLFLRELRIKV
jgi:hypothetical protein